MPDYAEGELLLVDKPLEWTSFDVVKKLKNLIRRQADRKVKLGHAGTLDPLASGLLILCSGKMTKQISGIQSQQKEYTGEFYLGATTPTFDLESEAENFQNIDHLTEADLDKVRKQLSGQIEQYPPIHSAVKIQGKRAYELARKGKEVAMSSKTVEIYEFELTKIDWPVIGFRIVCSKGTYIRSMANDFGKLLGVGAYLKKLRRTRIGDYQVEQAKSIEEWQTLLSDS